MFSSPNRLLATAFGAVYVVVGLLGFTVGGVGLMFDPAKMAIFWVGVGIVLVAGVIFIVMDRMGLGTQS